ncbi:MarR family winged helix-turn-helix transcriptional regulator [Leucothrix arctica]|nr:MarR family winged helix-turn-helix transcriptional regulator [Leucothrix arctica]
MNLRTSALTISTGNRLQSHISQFLQGRYDIGSVEWRMLVVLSEQPDLRMNQITQITEMDKAAVSRALTKLGEKRLAKAEVDKDNQRSKSWQLTPAGSALHDVVRAEYLKLQSEIFAGIEEAEMSQACDVLNSIKSNLDQIEDSDR